MEVHKDCTCGCIPKIPSLFEMAEKRRIFRLQQMNECAESIGKSESTKYSVPSVEDIRKTSTEILKKD